MYEKYQGEKRVCVRACFEASKTKLLLFSSFRCSIVYLHTPFLTPSLPPSFLPLKAREYPYKASHTHP